MRELQKRKTISYRIERRFFRKVLLTGVCFLVSSQIPVQANAESQFFDRVPEFEAGRSLGMGGTSVSSSKGLDAVFQNPAGISQSKNILSEAVIASPMVTAGEQGVKLYKDINSGTDTLEMVQKYSNKPQHVSVQNVTGIAFKRAAIGFLQRGQVDVMAGTDPYSGIPTAEIRANARAGLYLSSSRNFLDDSLMLGVTTKVAQKRELSLSKGVFDLQSELKGKSSRSLLNENMKQGTGIGADIGMIFKIKEMDTKPAFGIVARNLGMNYKMGVPQGKQAPGPDKATVDAGVSLEPGTRKSSSRIAVDFVDAFNAYKMSPYKRIHLGAELNFQSIVGFAAGLGQGYPSYGCYINFKIMRVEGGMYGAEMGKFSGDLKSRRYYSRVSVGWLE